MRKKNQKFVVKTLSIMLDEVYSLDLSWVFMVSKFLSSCMYVLCHLLNYLHSLATSFLYLSNPPTWKKRKTFTTIFEISFLNYDTPRYVPKRFPKGKVPVESPPPPLFFFFFFPSWIHSQMIPNNSSLFMSDLASPHKCAWLNRLERSRLQYYFNMYITWMWKQTC